MYIDKCRTKFNSLILGQLFVMRHNYITNGGFDSICDGECWQLPDILLFSLIIS